VAGDDELTADEEVSAGTESEYWAVAALSRRMSGMDIFEVVGLVALCAMSLRIVGSQVAGAVTLAQANGDYVDEKDGIANFLTWVGSFGEVTGIILLLGLLAFLW